MKHTRTDTWYATHHEVTVGRVYGRMSKALSRTKVRPFFHCQFRIGRRMFTVSTTRNWGES